MTPMGQLSLCAEDDYLNATSGRTTMLAVRRLSAGERAPWWRTRVRLGELVSRSLVLIPSLYLAGAVALGVLLPALDRSHGRELPRDQRRGSAVDPPGGSGRHDRVRWTGGVGRGPRRSFRSRAALAAPRARVPT